MADMSLLTPPRPLDFLESFSIPNLVPTGNSTSILDILPSNPFCTASRHFETASFTSFGSWGAVLDSLLLWKKFEMNNGDEERTVVRRRVILGAWKAADDATKNSATVMVNDLMIQ
jgi:hypothetical protein